MINNQRSAVVKALLAVVIWGASFVATKIAVKEISPDLVVFLRFGMGVIILGALVWQRKQLKLPEKKDWGYLMLLGFLGITFHQWLQSTGLVTAQAVTTGWILASIPVFMVVLSWIFLKEKLTWLQIAGICLAAFGVLLIITKGALGSLFSSHFGTIGDLLILISAPNWAVFSILSKRGLDKYPAGQMMFYIMVFGWIFSSLLLINTGDMDQIHNISISGWLAISFLGIFCSGVAYIFWFDALQTLTVSETGVFLYLEPVVTVFVASLFLGEKLFLASLLGGLIILLGVWMVNRRITQ
jgi:drug/metabolite transporter (DMT)-like permease